MARGSFIFRRVEKTRKPYYEYYGYFRSPDKNRVTSGTKYPIQIYFGKDEIAVYYVKKDSKIIKIFSLYVAEGTINQNMLSKKVEDYAHMPLWPANESPEMEEDLAELQISRELLATGFFANYYGFALDRDRFIKTSSPISHPDVISIEDNGKNEKSKLIFQYGGRKLPAKPDSKEREDTWVVETSSKLKEIEIKASRINFLKILLDFLFELEYGTTFEGENFFRLQPILQNNPVLDALTRQCRYLSELRKLQDFEQTKNKPQLPKPFRDAEKEWLNICRLAEYRPVFVSPHSLFHDQEREVQKVVFEARIGKGKRDRQVYLKNREDAELKNNICSFFMRKYNLGSACRILLPPWAIGLLTIAIISIPFGDFFLDRYIIENKAGFFSIVIPLSLVFFMLSYHVVSGLNLFKLLLPRLFLGIMVGWAIFTNTEELWKLGFTLNLDIIIPLNFFLLIILFLYIYTDISNQIFHKEFKYKDFRRIAIKATGLIAMALIISLAMGFYVIQLYAGPMLENSEILDKVRFPIEGETTDKNKKLHPADTDRDGSITLDEYLKYCLNIKENKEGKKEKLESRGKYTCLTIIDSKFENYKMVELYYPNGRYIIYIWSLLFTHCVTAILLGIVLQLIWEDRPITEPL